MDRSKNSIQMGYQCKNPFAFAKLLPLNIVCKQLYVRLTAILYAVCLSSTFSSVAHFRCRLHF